MKRPESGAPARLMGLREAAQAALAGTTDPDPILQRRLHAPVPTESAAATDAEERLVVACLAASVPVPRPNLAAAVRTSLARWEAEHPGKLVEVRVPPFGAIQIGIVGVASAHTRGTPPNVVETDAATRLALTSGQLTWQQALAGHRVRASGAHADLADLLPA